MVLPLKKPTLFTGIFCGGHTIWCWRRHGEGQQAQAKQDQHHALCVLLMTRNELNC